MLNIICCLENANKHHNEIPLMTHLLECLKMQKTNKPTNKRTITIADKDVEQEELSGRYAKQCSDFGREFGSYLKS